MRPTALTLNILVAIITTTRFYRVGAFSWDLFWPFALASMPFAYLGYPPKSRHSWRPGCMTDGETPEEAMTDARGAFECWMTAHAEDGRPIPTPRESQAFGGHFVGCIPENLHARLERRAREEGVSTDQLVIIFIAEGLASHHHVGHR